MSVYREAQQWLESNGLYPRSGLADVRWSPRREYLAFLTRTDQVFLCQTTPPDLLWMSEPGLRIAGVEFVGEDHLVCRRYPPLAESGVSDAVQVRVGEEEAGIRIRTISVETECRTFGMSLSGRFLLLGRGVTCSEPPGTIDLGHWNETEPGVYDSGLLLITGIGLEPNIRYAWLAEGARKMVLREVASGDQVRDRFFDTTMAEARTDPPPIPSRRVAAKVELPEYPWARPDYLWSDDGRWFAARIREQMPSDWDEIPVGGPELREFVAVYDGATGSQLWSHQVESVWGPFEWTEDGLLEAAERLWDPATGEELGPVPS